MASLDPVKESLWRPRGVTRLVVGLLMALALPPLVTKLVLTGIIDRFPSLVYVACVVAAAILGRLVAGLLAVAVSVLVLDYFIVDPRWSFTMVHSLADAIDFIIFVAVGVLIAAVLSGTDRSRSEALHARERADLAQRQLTVVADVSRTLAASFDLAATVRQACELVAGAGGWDHVAVLRHDRAGFHFLAEAHGSAVRGKARAAQAGPFDPGPALEAATIAVRSRQVQTLPSNSWRTRLFGPWRYRAGLVVPLVGGAGLVGVLVLLNSARSRTYLPADELFAGEIAGRIAVAIENSQRYQQQVHIAHTLQQGLLPRNLPAIPGVTVHALYQAGAGTEVGGDFYDVFAVDENRWIGVVGDVCGKGPEAATVMSITRATLRALAMHEPSPSRLLTRLNEALLAQVPDGRFVTVSCAVIEVVPAGGAKVILAQAGHPAPVISRKGSPPTLAPAANGMLLGAFPAVNLSESAIGLEPGEALTFYTDGIEAGKITAEEGALALLTAHGDGPASAIAKRFAAAVRSTPAGKADDLVVLTFEFTG
jgi:Stage II sporulation protein E (SpoIIE)/Domain of unknown function (DUF4118)/GAF domain